MAVSYDFASPGSIRRLYTHLTNIMTVNNAAMKDSEIT
jgi:hypothetical protein